MIFEIGGRVYNIGDNYFAPAWWDNWLRKNLKKKERMFLKRTREQED